jgi:post-segregation antitoxin (ccd killing protein)
MSTGKAERMRNPPFDAHARKRTVSLTLNADLYAKSRSAGINLSKVAEQALAEALARRLAEQVKADVRQDLEALDAFVAAHGSFSEMAREHYATAEGDAPV